MVLFGHGSPFAPKRALELLDRACSARWARLAGVNQLQQRRDANESPAAALKKLELSGFHQGVKCRAGDTGCDFGVGDAACEPFAKGHAPFFSAVALGGSFWGMPSHAPGLPRPDIAVMPELIFFCLGTD
jgi:hypothetical protein